jgi:four helix bundle protein
VGHEIRSYRDLVAWRLAVDASVAVYRVTERFPDHERYGLTQQLRRAAVSIPSNVAEGWGRGASQDNHRFLRMARGSLYEVETQLVIAGKLGYLERETYKDLQINLEELGRVLAGLIRSVEQSA